MPGRILIVEDNQDNLDLMLYLLNAFGYDPLAAVTVESGYLAARSHRPDLIICDLQLPDGDGYQLARQLRLEPALQRTPLVAVTAYAMVGDREKVLAEGFDGYISKPIDPETFVSQVEQFLVSASRSAAPQPPRHESPAVAAPEVPRPTHARVLVVDDQPVNLDVMRSTLQPFGYEVVGVNGVDEALAAARECRPDLIISDVHMPRQSGHDLLVRLRAEPELQDIPCILVSSSGPVPRDRALGIALGAAAFLMRPMDPEELLQEIAACLDQRTREDHGADTHR